MNKARRHAWAQAGALPPVQVADKTLDGVTCIRLDATVVTTHSDKELTEPNFKGFGHHPLVAECDNVREPLAWMLRPGSAGSNTTADHLRLLGEAIAALPPAFRVGGADVPLPLPSVDGGTAPAAARAPEHRGRVPDALRFRQRHQHLPPLRDRGRPDRACPGAGHDAALSSNAASLDRCSGVSGGAASTSRLIRSSRTAAFSSARALASSSGEDPMMARAPECPQCLKQYRGQWPGWTFHPESVTVADTSP